MPSPPPLSFGEYCRKQAIECTAAHVRQGVFFRLDDLAVFTARLPPAAAVECLEIIQEIRAVIDGAAAATLATSAGR